MDYTFEPTGYFILAKASKLENFTTKGNIELVNLSYQTAEVVEPTEFPEYVDVYKKGDSVLIHENAGNPINYKGESHIWLNARPYPDGHIIGRIVKDKK